MADGSLKFDTKIDTDGFEKDTKVLKDRINSIVDSLRSAGTGVVNAFSDTGAIDVANSKIQALANEIDQYRDALYYLEKQGLYFGDKEYDEVYQKLAKAERGLNQYKKELAGTDKQQKQTIASTKKLNTALKKTSSTSIPLTKSIFKLGNMFKLLILRMAMRSVIRAVQEGFQNLAQYSNQVNRDMSVLVTSAQTLKNSFASAFAPILQVVTPALKSLIDHLSQALSLMGQFFAVLMNGATTFTRAKDAQVDYAKSIAKMSKEASKALSPIDKLNVVGDNSSGGYSGPSPSQMFEEVAIDNKIVDFVDTVKLAFDGLGKQIGDFYNNWGGKDVFEGIKEGASLVDFSKIKENFKTSFSGWKEIAITTFDSLQPVYQSAGEALGTYYKYGIATRGNLFESITTGFANFTENMKGPIQTWIIETTEKLKNGFNNLDTTFETLGESWLNSIKKYKPDIEQVTEGIFTNIANTAMLSGTIIADSFEIITGKIKDFVTENEDDIQLFTDSILDMFTSALDLVNEVWEDTLNIIHDFWKEWGQGILDDVMDVVSDIGKWFLYLWNELVKPLWDEMLEWLSDIWNDTFKGIFEELLNVVGKIGKLIKTVWDNILKPLIDLLLKIFAPIFKAVFSGILEAVKTVVSGIGKAIKGLLVAFGGIIDFLTGVFSGNWEKAWGGIRDVFKGVFDSLVAIVKTPINLIIDIINGMVSGIVAGVNSVIKAVNSISFSIPNWVPVVGGNSVGFNLKQVSAPKIPRLATGTVVPANYGEFMAILGDNKREPEIVSPVSKIEEAVENVLNRRGGGSSGDIHIWLEGDAKGIFKVVRVAESENYAQTGKAVFVH